MRGERHPDSDPDRAARREKYRDYLVGTKQKSQQAHDDGILKVCGGALGVSFAFVNSFVEGPPIWRWLALLAWGSWGLALAVVIVSHRVSTLAADAAIAEHDARIVATDASRLRPGDSRWNQRVKKLNGYGWLLFLVGVLSMGAFIYFNYTNMEETQMAVKDGDTRSSTRTGGKPGSAATDSARPQPGAGTQTEERGHDIVPPPAGGTHSGQDSRPSRTPGRGSDQGTREKS